MSPAIPHQVSRAGPGYREGMEVIGVLVAGVIIGDWVRWTVAVVVAAVFVIIASAVTGRNANRSHHTV